MRALTRYVRTAIAFVAVALLCLASALVAEPAQASARTSYAAHADEVARPASVDIPDTPANPAGALIFVALAAAGVGLTLTLKAKDKDDKTQRFTLDTDDAKFGEQLDDFIEAKQDEATRPLGLQLAAATGDRDGYRELVVGEIVRRQQLAHTGEPAFDVEAETEFYNSLPPTKLKVHYTKALALKVNTDPKTTQGDGTAAGPVSGVTEEGDNAAFGSVKVD